MLSQQWICDERGDACGIMHTLPCHLPFYASRRGVQAPRIFKIPPQPPQVKTLIFATGKICLRKKTKKKKYVKFPAFGPVFFRDKTQEGIFFFFPF